MARCCWRGMGEAKVYAVHRYSLLANVLVSIVGALLLRGLLSHVVFALLAFSSLALFFFAYLGEEKSYLGTSLLGFAQMAYSLFAMFDGFGAYSATTLAYSAVLVALGFAAALRHKRSKAEGKKALSDFVPPAFG